MKNAVPGMQNDPDIADPKTTTISQNERFELLKRMLKITKRIETPATKKSPFSGTMILWPASLLQAFLHLNTNGSTFCT
jgi:hypothetical protein